MLARPHEVVVRAARDTVNVSRFVCRVAKIESCHMLRFVSGPMAEW